MPEQFAVPAGFGDVTAAFGATLLIPGLHHGTASRRWVLAWNIFGHLDLVMAIALGALYSPGIREVGVAARVRSLAPRCLVEIVPALPRSSAKPPEAGARAV